MPEERSDEFSAFDLPDFTEEEFAQIDLAISHSFNSIQSEASTSQSKFSLGLQHDLNTFSRQDAIPNSDSERTHPLRTSAGPKISIEVESCPDELGFPLSITKNSPFSSVRSYIQRYRPKRILSVTDLISPAWCEVQFEYGLLGKRSRPIAQRPKSFVSSSGKEIRVEQATAHKNDQTTKKGKAIHKVLEREIHPEDLVVEVATEEERWALRLLNTMNCLKEISVEGFTREMPVFGLIEGEVVVGIIDQVSKIACVPMPAEGTGGPAYNLQITDTKTRRTDSLPPEEDIIPARLQVMLYNRLLAALVSLSQPFEFSSFWRKLRVDTSKTFSTKFLAQTGLSDRASFGTCLDELSNSLPNLVLDTGYSAVHPKLQLVYRLQATSKSGSQAQCNQLPPITVQRQSEAPSSLNSEELLIQWAILQSLSNTDSAEGETSSTGQLIAIQPPLPDDGDIDSSRIIGTKEVIQDDEFLDNYVSEVLKLWRGERKPKGVPLLLSRRCQSCEYRNDCEWREAKAGEFLENVRQRNTNQ